MAIRLRDQRPACGRRATGAHFVPESRDDSAVRQSTSAARAGDGRTWSAGLRAHRHECRADYARCYRDRRYRRALRLSFCSSGARPDPMVRCDLFESRDFSAANIYTFFLYTAIGGSLYFVPFVLINVHHYTPTQAGAALLPFIFIMVVASRWSGGLVARIGARTPLILGAILAALGFLAFALPGNDGSYWTTFFPAATILGCGGALFVAPLTTTVMNSVPVEHSGVASGINNAVARTAGLIGVAVLGVVVSASVSYTAGFRSAMIASAILAFAASVVAAKGFARFEPAAPS